MLHLLKNHQYYRFSLNFLYFFGLQSHHIKPLISKKFTKSKILYGGSVNPKNIKNLMRIDNIDGFLIGGASTDEKIFIDIMKKSIN